MESHGATAPWLFLALFITASALMIWRLEAMSEGGFEGTVLGTLIMPYCSGIGNLIFAFVLGRKSGPGTEVMTNALVNNDIHTIKDLFSLSDAELRDLKGFGSKALDEVKEKLAELEL